MMRLRRPPAAFAGLLLLMAFISLIVTVILAGTGSFTLALRVLALTAALLLVGWFISPPRR